MKLLWIISLIFVVREGACVGVCTTPGRFPNNTRDDCRGYVMCLKGATTITHYNLVCPDQSVYSHIDNQCTNVTSYQCLSNYTCLHEGNFANDLNDKCDSYIACIQDLNKIVSPRLIKCPEGTIFSVSESGCVNSTVNECIVPKTQEVSEGTLPEPIDDSGKTSTSGTMHNINNVLLLYIFSLFLVLYCKQ